jgi:presenilin-like A22 family membrane protease
LHVSNVYSAAELPYGIEPPEMDDAGAISYLLFAIIFMTVILLLLQRFELQRFIKLWFGLAFFLCVSISLSVFVGDVMAMIGAFILMVMRFRDSDLYVHNIGEVLVYGGVAAIFSPILTLFSIGILMILISIYDFIAVFVTRHMVTLAEGQRDIGIFSGLLLKYKDEAGVLGGGDIAFPLLFAAVAMKEIGTLASLFSVYGATLGLISLIILGRKNKYYPALPFITLGSFLGFALSLGF